MKTQASFPSLAASRILIRAQSWETEFCQSSKKPTAYTDALLAADWPTCDYWNCNLSLAFRWSEPCSGQIRPKSASDHCTGHWEQIWMNFNWKSWKMLSARHRVDYDITLIPGVSAKNGSNCSTEEKCKQWMRNIKYTFNRLTIVKNYEKIWILRRVSL